MHNLNVLGEGPLALAGAQVVQAVGQVAHVEHRFALFAPCLDNNKVVC